jgi:hypothetical protein
MKERLCHGLLLLLIIPSLATAQTRFDGTWRVDFQSAMPTKVNVWLLKDGTFRCTSCSPPIEVRADGSDQPVSGQQYDTISVQVVDPQTVREIEKKNRQTVSDEKLSVSGDGKTVTDEFGNWRLTLARTAAGPAGAHKLSGSWKPVKMESISDRELLLTYKLEGDTFSMSRPTGQSYTAKLGGPDAVYSGDPDINGVTLRQTSPNVIEETDKKDGKVVSVTTLTLAKDGKSLTVSVKDLQDGSTSSFTMLRH